MGFQSIATSCPQPRPKTALESEFTARFWDGAPEAGGNKAKRLAGSRGAHNLEKEKKFTEIENEHFTVNQCITITTKLRNQ
jgi:hypothetical protein